MNDYEKILNMISITNNIPKEDIRFNIQFSKCGGHHIQEYTYIIIPLKRTANVPEKVWELLGNLTSRDVEISTRWGYMQYKFKLDEPLAERLYEEEQQYTNHYRKCE